MPSKQILRVLVCLAMNAGEALITRVSFDLMASPEALTFQSFLHVREMVDL